MANPQAENGHTDLANELLEAIAKQRLSGQEFQVLLAIIRRLYGWKKKEDWLSNTQLADDTGLNRIRISEAIRGLVLRNIVTITEYRNSWQRVVRINKDFDTWQSITRNRKGYGKTEGTVTRNRNPLLRETVTTKETITKEKHTKENNTISEEQLFETESPKQTKSERKRARIQHWNSKPGLIKATVPPSNQLDRALDQAMQQATDEEIDLCTDNFHASKAKWVRNIISKKAWGFYTFLIFKDGINLSRFLYGPINDDFDKSNGADEPVDRYAHLRGTELDQ